MEGIKKMYLRVSSVIALIVFPFMILLAVLTEPIVFLIFGEQWLPIVDTLRILSIIGMFQSVSSLIGIIFIVFKQNNLAFRITLITSILTIIIIIWFVYIFKSIELTSLVYGISNLLFLYPMYYYAARIMNISVVRLLYPLIYPLIFSLLIGLFGRILFYALPFDHIFLKLLISLPSALCLYIGLCVCFKNQTFYDLLKVLDYLRSTK